MDELLYIIEDKWKFFEMVLIEENNHSVKYRYGIDYCKKDECGIIEFVKDTVYQIVQGHNLNLSQLLMEKKINVIKPFSGHKDFYLANHDLSILLPIRVLLKHVFVEDEMLVKNQCINMRYLERMKDIYPQKYKKIIKILKEEKELQKQRLS